VVLFESEYHESDGDALKRALVFHTTPPRTAARVVDNGRD